MRWNANIPDAAIRRDSNPRSPLRGAPNNFSCCPSFPVMASGWILQDQTGGLGMKTQQGKPYLLKREQIA